MFSIIAAIDATTLGAGADTHFPFALGHVKVQG